MWINGERAGLKKNFHDVAFERPHQGGQVGGVGSLLINVVLQEQSVRKAGKIDRLGVYTNSKSAGLHFSEITAYYYKIR